MWKGEGDLGMGEGGTPITCTQLFVSSLYQGMCYGVVWNCLEQEKGNNINVLVETD